MVSKLHSDIVKSLDIVTMGLFSLEIGVFLIIIRKKYETNRNARMEEIKKKNEMK